MLAIEPPRVGRVYHWSLADLMTRRSGDVSKYTDGHDWPSKWRRKLQQKRRDRHYPDVVESLDELGFIRPLDATLNFSYEYEDGDDDSAGMVRLADGHHRFAAAIDLGYEAVPILVSEWPTIAPDSGEWNRNVAISHRAGVDGRNGEVPSDYSGTVVSW
ncbi:ParB-like nuclease domain protein [Microbacterium phage Lahqtemish]|uniref:ParB-like nuclease domain protein n=1 Tax=Microbacterium phage Lahqtemish TaxID=2776867 RepID=UPI0018A3997E|nr:ParB-like nuclease domain protein [Microbacterium phage Lahqtemish]QOP66639.1 ParB-like nuclease domain protein [Microbacterium phage Lahqtemish]